MISVSLLIVDIDFPGGKCNLKMNITNKRRKRYKGEIYLHFVAKVQHLQNEKSKVI